MRAYLLTVLITLTVFVYGCERGPISRTRNLFRTQVTVTAHAWKVGVSREMALGAIEASLREIKRVEEMVGWNELRNLNNLAGVREYDIGSELVDMIEECYDLSEDTRGMFRPDLGPLVKLWEFGSDSIHVPDDYELDSVLEVIDSTIFTVVDDGVARLDPVGASLDLWGYAKGYAVDRACDILRKSGITAGIVEAGGDLRCFGEKPEGGPWRIAIRHPRKPDTFYTILNIDSGAVATSGDYERYVIVDGFRYHHIFDPGSGFPATQSVSATVISADCARADAYATGFFVLGPEVGVRQAQQLGLQALIIAGEDDNLWDRRTERFSDLVADNPQSQ